MVFCTTNFYKWNCKIITVNSPLVEQILQTNKDVSIVPLCSKHFPGKSTKAHIYSLSSYSLKHWFFFPSNNETPLNTDTNNQSHCKPYYTQKTQWPESNLWLIQFIRVNYLQDRLQATGKDNKIQQCVFYLLSGVFFSHFIHCRLQVHNSQFLKEVL